MALSVHCNMYQPCVCVNSQNKGRRTYFYTGFAAYFLGLMATIGIMHVFKHAQVGKHAN